ncbi:MAG: hypothetical protein EZS28_032655 [Streblomastix strix]|uniref:Uncharacterized protein n=1 Tax=Streblomastix strix TaxID=222440 RepID=A0A5J4UN08_9EUKA|nr:MAG: hypothetical protein EZS28_032655 [Streblomastix strix]
MAGGTNQQILLANGDTTTLDSKLSRTYSSGSEGNIRLCVFPTGTGTGEPYIQFQVTCNTNAMQTIDLVPSYTVNGIVELYGSYSSAVYTAWIHMMAGSGGVTVTVSKQSKYWATRVTEILTQDIVTSISGAQTQIPISYNLGNGGIINNMLQVNPMNRNYTTFNNGIRIGNYSNYAALYLGCDSTAINTTKAGSSTSFAGVTCGAVQINTNGNNFNEGLRISRSTASDYSGIYLGCNPYQTSGSLTDQWRIVNTPTGELRIGVGKQLLNDNQGLKISADGKTLSFNGRVL